VKNQQHPVSAQENGFAAEEIDAPETILRMADECQPRWTRVTGVAASVVLCEHATHDIFIDVDAEGMGDLLGDAYTAEPGVSALQLNNRRDEFCRGTFGATFVATVAEGKSRRYFRSTNTLWNLNSVAGLTSARSFGSRCGLTNNMAKPRTTRSTEVRLGARCRERLLMSNWCLRSRDSAATARTPPGRRSFATVTNTWMARMRISRTGRTVP